MSGERFLVAHLPAFRLERCGFLADEVAALVAEERGAVRIVALSPAAREAGLSVGMSATEARARHPGALLDAWDPAGEEADRAALAAAFGRLSDRVAVVAEDALAMEIGATAPRLGGEGGALAAAEALAEALGHAGRFAIADDADTARAIAVYGAPEARVVPVGGGAAALGPLPVGALFPSGPVARALAALGVERVAQLAALDPASLSGRFGEEGLRLHRLARGQAPSRRPLAWAEDSAPIGAGTVLGGPTVTLGPIHFALPGLLRQVCAACERRDLAVVRLGLRLVLDGGRARVVSIRVGRPTRSAETLERVARARLENLRLDAPVVELAVEVEETTDEPGWQPGLVDRTEGVEPLPELVGRLADALGAEAVCAPEPVATWRPEAAWRPAPFLPHGPPPRPLPPAARPDPEEPWARWERELPRPRPTRLLARAEPISVREEGGRPVALHGPRGWEAIARADGPEPLTSGWWDPAEHFSRAYWVVRTRAATAWVYREETGPSAGRWFRHGWFD